MWYDIERLREPSIWDRWHIPGGSDVVNSLLIIEDEQEAYEYFVNIRKPNWAAWHLQLLCDIFEIPYNTVDKSTLYKKVLDYMLRLRLYDDVADKIIQFRGDFGFLSMLYECNIPWLGLNFDCVETAFIASKTLDREIQELLSTMEVLQAQKLGKVIDVRDDWEEIKLGIAYNLNVVKYTNNRNMYNRLIATGNRQLIEGNDYYETFWGMCNGEGRNEAGKILMRVRRDLRNGKLIPNWELN